MVQKAPLTSYPSGADVTGGSAFCRPCCVLPQRGSPGRPVLSRPTTRAGRHDPSPAPPSALFDFSMWVLIVEPHEHLSLCWQNQRGGPLPGTTPSSDVAPCWFAVRRSGLLPAAVGRGRRRLLNLVRAIHALLGSEGNLYATRLEVVGLASILQEAGGVLEVAGVAELDSRRALAGVVARVLDRVAQGDVPALGLLLDGLLDAPIAAVEEVAEEVVVGEAVEEFVVIILVAEA